MITVVDGLGNCIDLSAALVWSVLGVALALTLAFYALRSIGLFVMAKKKNLKCAYLAWIPFAWIYVAGKLCGANRIFGFRVKNFTLILTIVFCIAEVITLTTTLMAYIPLAGYVLQGGDSAQIFYSISSQYAPIESNFTKYEFIAGLYLRDFTFAYGEVVIKLLAILNVISMVIEIFYLVFLFTMYFHLFRTYWPQHYFSAFIFSFFGLFPVFVFALRNKKPVNYEEFIKARYGDYARRNNPYYNDPFLHGPNGQNGGQNHENTNPFSEFDGGKRDNGEPFSEFDNKNSEPFSEFDDKNNGDK